MTRAPSRRVYETVGVERTGDGFSVTLDGRPLRTPGGRPLRVAGGKLARAIADEWAAQEDRIRPQSMPLMSLAATALDRTSEERPQVIAAAAAYARTDLVCYGADAPPELVERQHRHWQPLLDWAAAALGARLTVTRGVVPVAQPEDAVAALTALLEDIDDHALTALAATTRATGSLVIGLALIWGRIDADAAFEAAHVDELHQSERWGDDALARARREAVRDEIVAAARFAALGGAGDG